MGEVQQLNLCTVEIQPCYLPRHQKVIVDLWPFGIIKNGYPLLPLGPSIAPMLTQDFTMAKLNFT